ncbi:MAG: winged helix-turn-helix domain-containing protein, partial [Clostridia bacterium]|nr:winged helix-turn-helix domain-containing protein [Clostridia bacterium]
QQRLELLSKRTTRAKLCTYLFRALGTPGSKNVVRIPYNRLALADYLGVDRSAMSRELSKMRDEGLLEFRKNVFVLLDPARISTLANQY